MTEQEAISILENFDKQVPTKADGDYQSTIGMRACGLAITALEEIQQYRAIGTVEECREAVEKQREKEPIRIDKCTCPSCGTYNETVKKRRSTVSEDTVYCWHCGQAMDITRLE